MMKNKYLDKYLKMSAPAKAAIWFTFCNVLQKGISMITVPIFTRILNVEEYGIFNIYLSWMNILIIFSSLNLYYGVFNNAMIKYEKDRDKYTSSMMGLVIVITTILFGIYLAGHQLFNNLIGLSTTFMIFMFLELYVTPALQFWSARQRFEFKYKALVIITVVKSILNPLIGILAILITKQGAMARIVSMVLLELFVCGSLMIIQLIKGKTFYNKEYWMYAIRFNLPLLPHYLSGIILNQGDRVMINYFSGPDEVAIYSVAYNIGMLVQLFTNAINSSFTPWFYTSMREKKYNEIKNITNLLLLLMSILVICIMFFAPEVVKVFAPDEYYAAVYVIPPISASVFFIFMYVLFSNVEFYFEENKFILIASIIAAVLNIILNAIFIPIFGYLAAGYTTLFSYIIYCFAHYIFCRIVCRKHIGIINLYDSKFIIFLSFIVIATAIIFNILYSFFILRYIIATIFFLVVVWKRTYLINIIKLLKK